MTKIEWKQENISRSIDKHQEDRGRLEDTLWGMLYGLPLKDWETHWLTRIDSTNNCGTLRFEIDTTKQIKLTEDEKLFMLSRIIEYKMPFSPKDRAWMLYKSSGYTMPFTIKKDWSNRDLVLFYFGYVNEFLRLRIQNINNVHQLKDAWYELLEQEERGC